MMTPLVLALLLGAPQQTAGDFPPPPPPMDPEASSEAVPPDDPAEAGEEEEAPPAPPPAAAPEPPRERSAPRASPAPAGEEPDFLERFFPLGLDANLHPVVDENLWSFWAGTLVSAFIPFAQVWLPMVLVEEVPKQYVLDALVIYLLHVAPVAITALPAFMVAYVGFLVGFIGLTAGGCGGTGVGLLAAPCAIMGLGLGCVGVWAAVSLVNTWWCMPVAFANAYSRALIAEDAQGTSRRRVDVLRRRRTSTAMAY